MQGIDLLEDDTLVQTASFAPALEYTRARYLVMNVRTTVESSKGVICVLVTVSPKGGSQVADTSCFPSAMASNDLEATERTPLIPSPRTSDHPDIRDDLPNLCDVEQQISAISPSRDTVTTEAIVNCVQAYTLPSRKAHAALTLLLCLRWLSGAFGSESGRLSTAHRSSATDAEVDAFATSVWEKVLSEESEDDINELLWLSYPLKERSYDRRTGIF